MSWEGIVHSLRQRLAKLFRSTKKHAKTIKNASAVGLMLLCRIIQCFALDTGL